MNAVFRQTSPTTPVILLYKTERELTERIISEFGQKKQVRILTVTLSGMGQGEDRVARKYLHKGMEEGLWVLLQNAHNAIGLLNSLETMFAEKEVIDPAFRCWITAEAADYIPTRVLHTCVKVMIDVPRVSRKA